MSQTLSPVPSQAGGAGGLAQGLQTLAQAAQSAVSIEQKINAGAGIVTDAAAIAAKVAAVPGGLTKSNLLNGVTLAAAAGALPGLGAAVAPIFPAYAGDITTICGAAGTLIGALVVLFSRKPAVANPTTSAQVAPVATASPG